MLGLLRRGRAAATPTPITAAQRAHFETKGWLALPKLFSGEEVAAINNDLDAATTGDRTLYGDAIVVTLSHPTDSRVLPLRDATVEQVGAPMKINNLYLHSPVMLDASTHPKLIAALDALLGAPPVVINSLNFIFGSQQPAHVDTWYMPARRVGGLIVASICLEPTPPDGGPLFYYSGSHQISPHVFENDRRHVVDPGDQEIVSRHLEKGLEEGGFERESFLGQTGDVFIWHEQLAHGGAQIDTPGQSRRTLVVHYHALDCLPKSDVADHRGRPAYLIKEN